MLTRLALRPCPRIVVLPLLLVAGVVPAACGGGAQSSEGADAGLFDSSTGGGEDALFGDAAGPAAEPASGQMLYESPLVGGNTFACATCHALEEPAPDGVRRIGHPIGDAPGRPSYKNGQLSTLLEAVNSCREEWMNLDPWAASDPEWAALEAHLEEHGPAGPSDALTFSQVAPPGDSSGGDPEAGRNTFNGTCVACHGVDGVGTLRGPPIAGVGYPADFIVSKARTSGPNDSPVYEGLAGGIMPFWGADRLSDSELLDIAAWLTGSEPPPPPVLEEDMSMPEADGGRADDVACSSDHPMVGWTTELSTRFHMVGGTATVIDDCTIAITDFTFDGNGIDVRIYGGSEGDYTAGPALSDDLFNWPVGYDHITLTVRLPEGVTLDDLDGISVWCVAVGVSFGDGIFSAP